jgi:hypothetical protein
MAANPIFAAVENFAQASLTTADTTFNAATNPVTLYTATGQTRLGYIIIIGEQTVVAGIVRVFLQRGGVTKVIREIQVDADTSSATDPAFFRKTWLGEMVQNGDVIIATTTITQNFGATLQYWTF